MTISIDNKRESTTTGQWSNPGAILYDTIKRASNWRALLREAYLVAPLGNISTDTSYSASGVGYPHHVVRGGKLIIHTRGLQAAYSRARQQGIFQGAVRSHLERHYRELGLYSESTMAEHSGIGDDIVHDRWYRDMLGRFASPGGGASSVPSGGSVSGGSVSGGSASTAQTTRTATSGNLKTMSNDDLRAVVQRMNLEKQFNELSKTPPAATQRIFKKIMDNIENEICRMVGQQAVRQLTSAVAANTGDSKPAVAAVTKAVTEEKKSS